MSFFFQTIPVILKQTYFQEPRDLCGKAKKQTNRIRLKAIQDFKQTAGFGLPNCGTYYKASALVWIKEWMMTEK